MRVCTSCDYALEATPAGMRYCGMCGNEYPLDATGSTGDDDRHDGDRHDGDRHDGDRHDGDRHDPEGDREPHRGADLDAVLLGVRRYLDLDPGEEAFIVAALATAVSKTLTDEEPLWLLLVGPPGGGKSWIVTTQAGTGTIVALGPRIREIAKRWTITLPEEAPTDGDGH